jgi:hypothetical protein
MAIATLGSRQRAPILNAAYRDIGFAQLHSTTLARVSPGSQSASEMHGRAVRRSDFLGRRLAHIILADRTVYCRPEMTRVCPH